MSDAALLCPHGKPAGVACGLCRTAANPPRPKTALQPARNASCRFLGEPLTGRDREEAGLTHQRHWQRCGHPEQPLGANVCTCSGCGPSCSGYSLAEPVPEAGAIRNLLFHCYPRGSEWRWHAEQLRKRIGLFNGKRVLAVVTDGTTDPAGVVRETMGDLFTDIVETANDPALREVQTFEALFSRVESSDPREATLYAHSKGATRRGSVRGWCETLYGSLVDHWPAVQSVLQRHPLAGSFKKVGRGWPAHQSQSGWHYSGSWHWFRNADLFARDWRRIERFEHGIETYPSLHFSHAEAGTVFWQGTVPAMNLFDARYWRDTVQPAYGAWLDERKPKPPSPTSCLDRWLAAVSEMTKPHVLEAGTRAWDGRPPRHARDLIQQANPAALWTGIDIAPGDGVDVVADLHEVSRHFDAGRFDAVFLASVLEHVRRPWIAAAELAKVTRPGGLLFCQTHQSFPVHGYPSDYFRFTREGLVEVFSGDAGWKLVQSEYTFPCKVIPAHNGVKVLDWNFEAESWLNTEGVFERLP